MNNAKNAFSLNRTGIFLLLITVLVAVIPPYIIFVGQPSPARSMESICMQTSMETWLRLHAGESDAWWTPSWDGGIPRIEKPPLLVWLNLFAWRNLIPGEATMEQLAFGARLMTISLIMIGLASVFWIGLELKSLYAACMSVLVTGTGFLLIKQSHYATYDAQLMGWATLAIACGVRAMNPLRRPTIISRHWPFWGLAGLALGGAMMTKGPVGAVWVLAPLALLIALSPGQRLKSSIGLLCCALIGILIMVPWFRHAAEIQGGALSTLADEYKPIDTDQFRPLYYYLSIIALVFPWSFWWISSFAGPWKGKQNNLLRFFPLAWFSIIFLFLCAWPMRHQRYLVPLLPAAGLMTAIYIDNLVASLEHKQQRLRLLTLFWTIASIITILLPAYIILEPWLLTHGYVEEQQFARINLPGSLAAGAILLLMSACGVKSIRPPIKQKTFVYIATWMIMLSTFVYYGYSLAPHQGYTHRTDAQRLTCAAGDTPLFYLNETERDPAPRPAIGFALHTMRIIRPITWPQLEHLFATKHPFSVLIEQASPQLPGCARALYNLGPYEDDDWHWKLFRLPDATDEKEHNHDSRKS